jgi:hypothetical protein
MDLDYYADIIELKKGGLEIKKILDQLKVEPG